MKKKRAPRKQTDAEVSRRLEKTYGITLNEYNIQLAKQNGVCSICSRPPGIKRLHVDHDHKFRYKKVISKKTEKGWIASVEDYPGVEWGGTTKSIVVGAARFFLKRASVRGVLCNFCNRNLGRWHDNAVALRRAAEYLENFYRYGRTK